MTKDEIKILAEKKLINAYGYSEYKNYYDFGFIKGFEYADKQTKELQEKYDELDKDYSILNEQFVKSKEWNLEIVYSNKFKDKEIEQLQAKIDELENKQPTEKQVESDAVECNDNNIDTFINKYINDLPKNWRSDLDMYLSMKNAMLEALSYPEKYTIKQNI